MYDKLSCPDYWDLEQINIPDDASQKLFDQAFDKLGTSGNQMRYRCKMNKIIHTIKCF